MVRILDRWDFGSRGACEPGKMSSSTLPSITYHLQISRKDSQRHLECFTLNIKEQEEHATISGEKIVDRCHFTLTIDAVGHAFSVYPVHGPIHS
jgi:hypothetical protein